MASIANNTLYVNYGNGSTTGYFAVPQWTASATVTVGTMRRQLASPGTGNERVFICSVAGTTGSSEPTWVITRNGMTTDNTVTWWEVTGISPMNGDITNTPLSSAVRSGNIGLGLVIQNNAQTFFFILTAGSNPGAGEPTYNTTAGSTTTDGGGTWTCLGAVGNFPAWGAPLARMATALSWYSVSFIPVPVIFVPSTHAETQAVAFSGNAGSSNLSLYASVFSVSGTSAAPPTSLAAGASISTTGANGMTIGGSAVDWYGFSFNSGSGTGVASIVIGSSSLDVQRFTNCAFNLVSTGASKITLNSNINTKTVLENCTFSFSAVGQTISPQGNIIWRWTGSAITGSTIPTNLFTTVNGSGGGAMLIEGVDLSAITTNLFNFAGFAGGATHVLKDCKVSSTATMCTIGQYGDGGQLELINTDSGGNTYRHERYRNLGTQLVDTQAVRTSGASDGTTALSWRLTTTVYAAFYNSFCPAPIVIWNAVTGSNVTVTIQGLFNGTALPFNDNIYLDVAYLGTASSTIASRASNGRANTFVAHTALSASTVAWDSAATARTNSFAYSLGNLVKLASNSGRLFYCITAGTSAASEPGGYASAVDGGSVTDGTATFRALVRFSLSVTLSSPQPQNAGYIYAYVRAALASSVFWVDPLIVLS